MSAVGEVYLYQAIKIYNNQWFNKETDNKTNEFLQSYCEIEVSGFYESTERNIDFISSKKTSKRAVIEK